MTDSAVLAEVDASSIYSSGQAFIVQYGPYNSVEINLKKNGSLPTELSGSFTDRTKAMAAITKFMAKREEYAEELKRKKTAKRKTTKKVEDTPEE